MIEEFESENVTLEELKKWDKEQSRALSDPTLHFWRQFNTNTSPKVIDQSAIDIKSSEYTNKILNLAKEQKLRFPYQLKPVNFAGFMPEFPLEIEPEKQELQFSDPMITVSQLANKWCKQ